MLQTMRAEKWPILELWAAESLPPRELDDVRSLAAKASVPLSIESAAALERRCRSAEHQGYVARMPPYRYDAVQEVLAAAPLCPLYVILDSIQDPQNFGAVIRSADAMSVDAIFIAETRQVGVTSAVARSSAGAVNSMRIARVPDLAALARELKSRGLALFAASEKATEPIFDADLTRPAAVIIGNEARGISPELLQLCDAQVTIPQFGSVGSLNAAVSAGIILYEARRQRLQAHERSEA